MRTGGFIRAGRLVAPAVIACSALLATGAASPPPAQAESRIVVGGGGPLYYPNPIGNLPMGRLYFVGTPYLQGPPLSILDGYDLLTHMVGGNWFSGSSAQVVNYPASMGLVSGSLAAPGVDQAVAMGRIALDDQIKNATSDGRTVVVAALSEGTLVVDRELASLAKDSSAPPPDSVSFAMFSNPELGVFATYLPSGFTLPLVDYTTSPLPDSQYDVDVVVHQYDAWSDFPDRPWNLLAVVNALAGLVYFHNGTALATGADTIVLSRVTSGLGGTTTTYLIPSPTLPLLLPLRELGLPAALVDSINSALKPIVDAGYSRLTPQAGPHFAHGRLVGPGEPASIPDKSPAAARPDVPARPGPSALPRQIRPGPRPGPQAGANVTDSTSILAGDGVVLSGAPAHEPPTARLRIRYMGRLYTHVSPAARSAGVRVPSVTSSTPKVISSGRRLTQ